MQGVSPAQWSALFVLAGVATLVLIAMSFKGSIQF